MKLWTRSPLLQLIGAAALAAEPCEAAASGMKSLSGPGSAPAVHPAEKESFSLTKCSGCLARTCAPLPLGWWGEPTPVSATGAFSFMGSAAASCLKVEVKGEQQAEGPPGPVDAWRASYWPGETNGGVTDTWTYIPSMLIRLLPFFSTEFFLHCGWRSIRPKHVIYLFKKAILTKSCLQP